MEQDTAGKPSLPVQWAFVVQFRVETDVERDRFAGRVEHVVSGQATRFQSLEELLAFVARVLTAVRAQSPTAPSDREARGKARARRTRKGGDVS
jgi:hypothetical protein